MEAKSTRKRPLTVEEKEIKKERNRLASEKYRKRNRDLVVTLSEEQRQLEEENLILKETNERLEKQVNWLKELLAKFVSDSQSKTEGETET